MAKYHEHLRAETASIWDAIYTHPFIEALGAGTLDRDAFAFFVRQDYLYLQDFARALCMGGAKADDADTLELFTTGAASIMRIEQSLHGAFGEELGISTDELESTERAPVTQAYTRHLLAASDGTLAETCAAILPCYWVYWDVANRMAKNPPTDPMYARWVEAYTFPGFGERTDRQLALIDRLAPGASAAERARIDDNFRQSCRYEYLFWDQAHRQLTWPV